MSESQQLARDLRLSIWQNGRQSKNPQRQAEAELALKVAKFLDAEEAAFERFFGVHEHDYPPESE